MNLNTAIFKKDMYSIEEGMHLISSSYEIIGGSMYESPFMEAMLVFENELTDYVKKLSINYPIYKKSVKKTKFFTVAQIVTYACYCFYKFQPQIPLFYGVVELIIEQAVYSRDNNTDRLSMILTKNKTILN